jgi:Sulfotransferase family
VDAKLERVLHKTRKILTLTRGPEHTSGHFALMPSPERLMERVRCVFDARASEDSRTLLASKTEQVRHFDMAGMERVVAICNCGSSGSVLVASYLDGHDGVVLLPKHFGMTIYPFLERYPSLSLRDRLLAYAVFWTADPNYPDHFKGFFEGELALRPAEYLAAVNALCDTCSDDSAVPRESRRTFFRALHIVYRLACGRPPRSRRPLMVYAQHAVNDLLAARLVGDFPEACFIHTVRDPISNTGRLFERAYHDMTDEAAAAVISHLTFADIAHTNMEARTLTVRFEDLHVRQKETMREVADWLGLQFQPSLLESTFNGLPFRVDRGAAVWTGVRPAQAERDSRSVDFIDRCVLYAVLNEDFVEWGYSCPKAFSNPLVRLLTSVLLLPVPLKIELLSAREICRRDLRALPGGMMRLCKNRVKIASLLAVELARRLVLHKKVLQRHHSSGGEGRWQLSH